MNAYEQSLDILKKDDITEGSIRYGKSRVIIEFNNKSGGKLILTFGDGNGVEGNWGMVQYSPDNNNAYYQSHFTMSNVFKSYDVVNHWLKKNGREGLLFIMTEYTKQR